MHVLREAQSYQDDWRVIMKGCVQRNRFTVGRIYALVHVEPETASANLLNYRGSAFKQIIFAIKWAGIDRIMIVVY